MNNYTKGPWNINLNVVTSSPSVDGEWPIIAVEPSVHETEFDNWVANAALIASAPDLLESLMALLQTPEVNADEMDESTKQAIHKACFVAIKAKGGAE